HQARIARHVSGEDRGETAGRGHGSHLLRGLIEHPYTLQLTPCETRAVEVRSHSHCTEVPCECPLPDGPTIRWRGHQGPFGHKLSHLMPSSRATATRRIAASRPPQPTTMVGAR